MQLRRAGEAAKVEMQMTPMIDMVFQLLIYFLFTFRITVSEGDFNVKLPTPLEEATPEDLVAPLEVGLRADEAGQLRELVISSRSIQRR